MPCSVYRVSSFRIRYSAMQSTQKLKFKVTHVKTIVYERIFWYIVRLLLGRRDVTLGKPPKGWHFRAFCLIMHLMPLRNSKTSRPLLLSALSRLSDTLVNWLSVNCKFPISLSSHSQYFSVVFRIARLSCSKVFFQDTSPTCRTLRDPRCMLYFAVLTLARLACVPGGGFRRGREKRFRAHAHAGYCALLNAIIKCQYCRHRVT